MKNRLCRVCAQPLLAQPLLVFDNMPKAAQGFPDAAGLVTDQGERLSVCQCSGCGLVQLDAAPVPYFRDVIRAASVSQPVRALKRQQFTELIDRHGLHGGKVIEIGCGRGEFLEIWSDLNVIAHGLENAPEAVAACREKGLQVTQGYFDNPGVMLPHAPYDAFVFLMFLEHMPEPNVALRCLHDNLAADAVGIVEVPNFSMVMKHCLFSEFIADHLLYFTRATLTQTLQCNGFDILEYSEIRNDYVLSVTVRKRRPLDLAEFHAARASITGKLREFIATFPEKSVAVWGAGHQALAMMSLSDIGRYLKYVVDSAPFKQGKFTPATHLPIVPPEMLDTHPAAALIIMAASYSDEVAAIVRERFGHRLPVAILRETTLEILNA